MCLEDFSTNYKYTFQEAVLSGKVLMVPVAEWCNSVHMQLIGKSLIM